ncbi:MAG: WD40 repeat domain-containing protein [Thermoplasmata archaeon]
MDKRFAVIIFILLSIIISGCLDDSKPPQPHLDESEVTITTKGGFGGGITSISWNQNGSMLATSSFRSTIQIWDTIAWGGIINITGHDGSVVMVAWNSDGSKLASISIDGTLRIWDTSTWQISHIISENDSFLLCLSWNPDGSKLAAANFAPGFTVRIWDTDTWEIIKDIKVDAVVESISWSPNGEEIALAVGRIVKIYNTMTWEKEMELTDNPNEVYSVSYSPDGTMFALAINDINGTVKIMQTATWENIQSMLYYYGGGPENLAWSPDSSKLALWPNRTIVDIWNTSNWQIVQQLRGHTRRVYDLSWSPDGSKIATGATTEIKIWNITS